MLFDGAARLEIDSRPGRTIVTMDVPTEDGSAVPEAASHA
jgi:hypothetical protein